MNESAFEGSPLQTEVRNCKIENFKFLKTHTAIALEKQPNSKFWKEANKAVEIHKFNKSK